MLVNSFWHSSSDSGNTTLSLGTDVKRGAPVSYFYNYGYNCMFYTAAEMSDIPNGANIEKISFEIEAVSSGTFNVLNQHVWIFQHNSGTEFPANLQINGDSLTDTTWNADKLNYTKIYDGETLGITAPVSPDIMWHDMLVPSSFTWTANKPFCICWNNKDDDFQPGTSSYPRGLGIELAGTQPRYWAFGRRDSTIYPDTFVTNMDGTFRPNIRVYWN